MQSEQTIGITFRETMAGPFALGETDPRAGEKKGKEEKSALAMHAVIHIRDIKRFSADPDHLGEITGEIDFSPFGTKIPATGGAFNLFSPADHPKLKLMIYELGFQHAGETYYLAGKKEVRDDPGFDLWKDTTTLLTRLHRGKDKSGPVVGAGVLSLDVKELMKLLSTFRATNARSAKEELEAVGAFGRFFLGELWNTYGR